MAQLETSALPERWSARQTRAQYSATAALRWRILLNGFRRKGGGAELAARIIILPIALVMLLAPTLGAGFVSWYFASEGKLDRVTWVFWGVFILCQMLNLNLGQPGTTFDPTQLIRFPMRVASYVAVRLFFGLLAPANVIATAMSLAVAVGVSVALPALWPWVLSAVLVFAATNIFFTRMVFAWVDRWMSTRRAREVFTALIFTVSLGFQYLNVNFNPAYNHHHRRGVSPAWVTAVTGGLHRMQPVLDALPPGLTGQSIVSAAKHQFPAAGLQLAGCAMFAAAFLAVFSMRMRAEFRGESLSDSANAVARTHAGRVSVAPAARLEAPAPDTPQQAAMSVSSAVSILLGRELLYLRRNTGIFYSLVVPMVMVLLFAGRLASHNNTFWTFPIALAYTLLGLAPLAYNSFGLEGAGVQFFFLSPVPLRNVFLAKNLMTFLLGLADFLAVFGIITYIGGRPSLQMLIVGLLWASGTLLINTSVGNFRSVTAAKKINLSRTANKQTSPLSALLSIGLLLAAAGLGAGTIFGARYFHATWVLPPIMLVYAVAGLLVYRTCLRSIDAYTLCNRDSLFEELCKA